MPKTYKTILVLSALFSAVLEGLLYWLDDDPPYADWRHTATEVIFFYVVFLVFYFLLFCSTYLVYRELIAAFRKGAHGREAQ